MSLTIKERFLVQAGVNRERRSEWMERARDFKDRGLLDCARSSVEAARNASQAYRWWLRMGRR